MPEILDAGTIQLSNADVLSWVRAKRAQHEQEDAADKEAGRPRAKRPLKFMNSLRRHERELLDDRYAYAGNPAAYEGANRNLSLKRFIERCDEDICYPLEEQQIYREPGITLKQLKSTLGKVHEIKSFTAAELLMIQNLAPENVSMLELIIENSSGRFTTEELEHIVQIVSEVFRCGDKLPDGQG